MPQNNSLKKQARELQARTGMPYTRALREVTTMTRGDSADRQGRAELSPGMLLPPLVEGSADRSGPDALRPLPFGRTSDGNTLALDLSEAGGGANALLVGSTGTGKSTLLHTLAYGLCAQHQAGSLRLVFVHGHSLGFALSNVADYPHVATISGPETASQVLQGVRVEDTASRRTVVMVDGFDILLSQQPDALTELEFLMRSGRTRGIHVVLACQQITVEGLERLVENATARIALRTVTEQCSREVIGTSEAAFLPTDRPGLGLYVGRLGDTPMGFQTLVTPRSLVVSTAAQWREAEADE